MNTTPNLAFFRHDNIIIVLGGSSGNPIYFSYDNGITFTQYIRISVGGGMRNYRIHFCNPKTGEEGSLERNEDTVIYLGSHYHQVEEIEINTETSHPHQPICLFLLPDGQALYVSANYRCDLESFRVYVGTLGNDMKRLRISSYRSFRDGFVEIMTSHGELTFKLGSEREGDWNDMKVFKQDLHFYHIKEEPLKVVIQPVE